jgi:hypothetical protein
MVEGLADFVLGGHGLLGWTVPGPVGAGERKLRERGILVGNGVPHSVQVVSTVNGGKFLTVTTSITTGVVAVNFGNSVEGLMDVTNVVDNKAQGKGTSISFIWEVRLYGLVVVATLVISTVVGEPCGEVLERIKDISGVKLEAEVIKRATLVKVGLIDEVPAGLETVTISLDVIGKGGALCDGVVFLAFGEGGVGCLKDGKFGKDSLVGSVVLGLDELLCTSGD